MFKQIEAWLAKHDEDRRALSKRERDLVTKWQAEDPTKGVEKLARAVSLMRD